MIIIKEMQESSSFHDTNSLQLKYKAVRGTVLVPIMQ